MCVFGFYLGSHSIFFRRSGERYIERIVDGLLSVVATMRVLPVLRCPPGEAAQMIAERLEDGPQIRRSLPAARKALILF